MLTDEQKSAINARLTGIKDGEGNEITVDRLTEVYTAEEEAKIEAPKVNLFSDDDLGTLKQNAVDEKYDEIKRTGAEMLIKDIKNSHGLDFEGKTAENLVEAMKAKFSNTKPDEQVQQLQEQYNTLKQTYESEKEEWNGKYKTKEQEIADFKLRTQLQQDFSGIEGIKPAHAAMIFREEYTVENGEKGEVVKDKKGNIMRDKLGNALSRKDVTASFAAEQGWTKKPGRGGDNEPHVNTGKFKNKQEAMKHCFDNNIDVDSAEGKEILAPFYEK